MGKHLTSAPTTGERLEIRLFGQADVLCAGVPLKFAKRSTTLAMLALIILQRGQSISRDVLAFRLFPEMDETVALAELRRLLYLANKSLPERDTDPWLIIDAETVRWNESSGAQIDVIAFERFASQAQTQAQAIDLYTGDLLDNIYDDWVVIERERLRARYLAILTESLDRYRVARQFAEAIACAKRLLATDPWREDTLRSLLALRYESGDTAGALAEFERFAKRLRDELAIAPMPETVAVRASILRNEALPGSPRSAPFVPDAARTRSTAILPFVGRQRDMAALTAAWSRAAHGAGEFVLVSGEAGVGKTRLTAELSRIVQSQGGRVLVGTTAAPESSPYQALVEALRSGLPLLLARPPAAARRATLARLIPELREPSATVVPPAEQTAERDTTRIFDALANAVRGLAYPRPLLLILEDLQWAGSASIEAIGAIVKELARAPLLIVATCRDEETPPSHPLRALQRSLRIFENVEERTLDRLGQADVAELVDLVAGVTDRTALRVADLFAASEGNALFLNEEINRILEGDRPTHAASGTSIEALVGARIANLSEHARAVAEIAAVAGAGCNIAVIREVSNASATSIATGFDELLDRRIMREASSRARYDYVFSHHLIAQAIYAEIEPAFRAQRHLRIARILEREHADTAAVPAREIARHYEQGGNREHGAQWYLTAAREAAVVHAYGDAIELASRALDNAAAAEVRVAALDVRERARGRRGDRSGQREDIDLLDQLSNDDPRRRFDVLLRRVFLARSLGESEREGRLIIDLCIVAGGLDDGARAQALVQRATHDGLRSRQAEGIPSARAALELYEGLGDVRGQLDCLYLLVDFATNVGDIAAARTYLEQMRGRAGSLGDQVVEARALSVAAQAALLRQGYRECFELTQRALALQIATNDPEGEAYSRGRLAATCAWLGDFGMALREFELALASYESVGNKRGVALTYTNRTLLLMRLGLFTEALVSIERSNALFSVVNEQRMVVANRVNASFVHVQLGDAAAAKILALSALEAAKEIGFPVFEAAALANLGNAERALGELDAAIAHMEAGIALRRPLQEPRDFVDDLADLTIAYVAAGRRESASATAGELLTLAEPTFTGAFWPHYAWWAISLGFAASGDASRADEAVTRAGSELRAFADLIEDGPMRVAFLAVPVNARIAAEVAERAARPTHGAMVRSGGEKRR